MGTALIVLAAGRGTRMKSDRAKVLHEVAGAPLLVHALKAGATLSPERSVVVAGHGAEAVERATKAAFPGTQVVIQAEQLGTGHAVSQARAALEGFEGDAIVLYGDTPFIRPETLETMIAARRDNAFVVLGFEPEDTGRYGRLVTRGNDLLKIVEHKEATEEERAITLCNSGVIAGDAQLLLSLLDRVGNDNATGEYYLTDVIGLAREEGLTATVVRCSEEETLGVNTRAQLAGAEAAFQARARAAAMDAGVTLTAPETVHFAHDTEIGADTVVEPNVFFGPGVSIATGATIRANSYLESCHVGAGAEIGPFARLRPGAELDARAKVGNFVEVKKSRIGEGAKVNHLSYIGDAYLGPGTNVGAGTITCNYDGVFKHRTEVGRNVFLGSNTMLVAPVTLGDGAMTASGTVVTRDVPEGAMAIGRARQENKEGFATRLFGKLRAMKERKGN